MESLTTTITNIVKQKNSLYELQGHIDVIDDNIKLSIDSVNNKHKLYLNLEDTRLKIGTVYTGRDTNVCLIQDKELIGLIRDVYARRYNKHNPVHKDIKSKRSLDELFRTI